MPTRSQTEPHWQEEDLQALGTYVSVLGRQWTEIAMYFDGITPKAIESKIRACVRDRDGTVLEGIRTFNQNCLRAGLSKHLIFAKTPVCFFEEDRIRYSMLFPSSAERGAGTPEESPLPNPNDDDDESSDDDDPMCCICRAEDMDSTLIVCDREPQCTAEFHLSCLAPPLAQVPVDAWLCPRCSITCFLHSAGLELRSGKNRRNGGKRSSAASASADGMDVLLGSLQEPQKVKRVREIPSDAPWLAVEEEHGTGFVSDPFDQAWPALRGELAQLDDVREPAAVEPRRKRARRK